MGATSHVNANLLNEEQRRDIWAKLDDGQAAWARKRAARLAFDCADVKVRLTHPGGGVTTRAVYAHDLSAGGTSFLHHGYVHVGTAVSVTIPRRLGGEETVLGRVAWCRHGVGAWHGVDVKFNEPIFPKTFVQQSEWERAPAVAEVAAEDLAGHILLLDDQEMDEILFKHMLRAAPLSIDCVRTVDEALGATRTTKFDVVCVDLNLGIDEPQGEQLITTLRSQGYEATIMALSSESGARLEAARQQYDIAVLQKPYQQQQLLAALGAALGIAGISNEAPLFSELPRKEGVDQLLQQFVANVQASMRDLRKAITEQRLEKVRMICMVLRGSASGYGFPNISTAAAEAVKALDACGDVGEASPSLQKLQGLCQRVSPNPPG